MRFNPLKKLILTLVGVVTLAGLVAFAADMVVVDLKADPPVIYQQLPFVNNCERQSDDTNWIYAVTIDPAMRTDDFQLFEMSGEGTLVGSGSIDFSQRFGRTPGRGELPVGALKIHATTPSASPGQS